MLTDIRVREIETVVIDEPCRTPLKFGAVVVECLPMGYARATVETRTGQTAVGYGAMALMDLWAWPAGTSPHDAKQSAMREVFEGYAHAVADRREYAHPVAVFSELEDELRRLSTEAVRKWTPGEDMPHLGSLICASPTDHAVHDAFGNALGLDSYLCYGPEHMEFDLARYLGHGYEGVYPASFLRQRYLPRVPVFHLVGGLDALAPADVAADAPDDGIPNSFDEWIARDGVFCLKVKLRGRDMEWDVARTLDVSRIYREVRAGRRPDLPASPVLTADTNEQCESPDYIVEYLVRLREREPRVFDEILYIEQPTERALTAHRWDMRPIAALKPVLIDESLASVDDFRLAMELGWSGVALKSCKCLSEDLLFLAMAELEGIPYAVQDLTNPSLALIESIGLAARIHTIRGVEANSRQFAPSANARVARAHGGLCEVRDGYADVSSLRGPGLGYRMDDIAPDGWPFAAQ